VHKSVKQTYSDLSHYARGLSACLNADFTCDESFAAKVPLFICNNLASRVL
jgi:hypothetical protein